MYIKVGYIVLGIFFSLAACQNKDGENGEENGTENKTAADTSGIIIADTASAVGKWATKEEQTFMTKCITGSKDKMNEGKAQAYCACMLAKIEDRYPVADSAAQLSLNEMMGMAKECLK